MNTRPQFSLGESLIATAFAAAGLGLSRVVLFARDDGRLIAGAIAASCCFGAAAVLIGKHSFLGVLIATGTLPLLAILRVFTFRYL